MASDLECSDLPAWAHPDRLPHWVRHRDYCRDLTQDKPREAAERRVLDRHQQRAVDAARPATALTPQSIPLDTRRSPARTRAARGWRLGPGGAPERADTGRIPIGQECGKGGLGAL